MRKILMIISLGAALATLFVSCQLIDVINANNVLTGNIVARYVTVANRLSPRTSLSGVVIQVDGVVKDTSKWDGTFRIQGLSYSSHRFQLYRTSREMLLDTTFSISDTSRPEFTIISRSGGMNIYPIRTPSRESISNSRIIMEVNGTTATSNSPSSGFVALWNFDIFNRVVVRYIDTRQVLLDTLVRLSWDSIYNHPPFRSNGLYLPVSESAVASLGLRTWSVPIKVGSEWIYDYEGYHEYNCRVYPVPHSLPTCGCDNRTNINGIFSLQITSELQSSTNTTWSGMSRFTGTLSYGREQASLTPFTTTSSFRIVQTTSALRFEIPSIYHPAREFDLNVTMNLQQELIKMDTLLIGSDAGAGITVANQLGIKTINNYNFLGIMNDCVSLRPRPFRHASLNLRTFKP